MTEKYLLMDRDGVINQDSDDYIKSAEEWQPIARSLEAIALLNQHGFRVVVISNQSGLARGYYTLEILEQMHTKMRRLLAEYGGAIDSIYICPHAPEANCNCRKPKTGLLTQFSHEKQVDLQGLFLIGDRFSDLAAGYAVGATPLLVKTGQGLRTLAAHPNLTVPTFETLYDAACYLITTT
jgi:D-glycero-D-manno-heptose 1,7-bisphosphate phosphatase